MTICSMTRDGLGVLVVVHRLPTHRRVEQSRTNTEYIVDHTRCISTRWFSKIGCVVFHSTPVISY